MRTAIICALACALGGDLDEATRKDRAAMEGTWRVTASEQNGERVPEADLKDLFLIFEGPAIYIREGGKTELKFASLLYPTKKPKEIDLMVRFGPNKGRVDRAIYEIDGDTLRLCIQADTKEPRPRDFTSRAGAKTWLVVMQRVKS